MDRSSLLAVPHNAAPGLRFAFYYLGPPPALGALCDELLVRAAPNGCEEGGKKRKRGGAVDLHSARRNDVTQYGLRSL